MADGTLVADYSGIRPKLSGRDQPAADFMVQVKECWHDAVGWVPSSGGRF